MLNDINAKEILNLWIEISNTDPETCREADSMTRVANATNIQIQEALLLDPSEITAMFMLDHLVTEFIKNKTVSINDLVIDIDSITIYLSKIKKLKTMLSNPVLKKASSSFVSKMKILMFHYDCKESFIDFANDHYELAFLRRDALRSMKRLSIDQFMTGDYEKESVKPAYVKQINMFWNVNSLLSASISMPSGVSLNLIKHPMGHQSYFAFCIRNGGNIYILSDKLESPHPLHAMMSRRPERALEDRSFKNWFPYSLLGLDWDEETGEPFILKSKTQGIVPIQSTNYPIKNINELEKHEATWIIMMFDQILSKFWRNKHQEDKMSYTADVFTGENRMEIQATNENLPVYMSNLSDIYKITREDVFNCNLDEDAIGKTHGRLNKWLEDRFINDVDETCLNIVSTPEQAYAINKKDGGVVCIDALAEEKLSYEEQLNAKESRIKIEITDGTSFGKLKEIKNNRLFISRFNAAKRINSLAKNEFDSTKDFIRNWVFDKINNNMNYFFNIMKSNDVILKDNIGNSNSFSSYGNNSGRRINITKTRSDAYWKREFFNISDYERNSTYSYGGFYFGDMGKAQYRKCFLTGAKSCYKATFYPECAKDLAEICNCEISDLPEVLQHYLLFKQYTGNSILYRVDPMLWALKDPWKELDLRINFFISKRAMNRIKNGHVHEP